MTPEQLRSRLINLILAGVIANDGHGPDPTTGQSWLAEKCGVTVASANNWLHGRTRITKLRAEQIERVLSEAEDEL